MYLPSISRSVTSSMHLCVFHVSTPMTHATRDNTTDTESQAHVPGTIYGAQHHRQAFTDKPQWAPHQAQVQQLRAPGKGHDHAHGSGAPIHAAIAQRCTSAVQKP
jgi:hypothetical protein